MNMFNPYWVVNITKKCKLVANEDPAPAACGVDGVIEEADSDSLGLFLGFLL